MWSYLSAVEPGFYSTNWLYIGKCYLQLGRVQEGGEWLKKVAAYHSEVEEDLEAQQEAIQLLKKLGINWSSISPPTTIKLIHAVYLFSDNLLAWSCEILQ